MPEITFEATAKRLNKPDVPIIEPPIFIWPPQPIAAAKYLFGYPGYFIPMNIIYMILAIVSWFWLTPNLETMQTFQWDWVAIIYGRNLALAFLVFGGLHWRFYIKNAQGENYMLNRKSPTQAHYRFLFGKQVRENMFLDCRKCSGNMVGLRNFDPMGLRKWIHSDAELGGTSSLFCIIVLRHPICP